MKIRNGFVSNSSSSSFLVSFKTLPTSVEQLREMLFGDRNHIELYDEGISTQTAASVVWNDIQRQERSPTRNELVETLRSKAGYLVYEEMGGWYSREMSQEERELYHAEDRRRTDVLAEQLTDEFLQQAEGGSIYGFSYADDDGTLGMVLEHWGIFRELPHVAISNH